MKGLKEFFSMIVTAVICFTMNVFSGNKKGAKVFSGDSNAVRSFIKDVVQNSEGERKDSVGYEAFSVGKNREGRYKFYSDMQPVKKVSFLTQGPGDMIRACRSRSPSYNKASGIILTG